MLSCHRVPARYWASLIEKAIESIPESYYGDYPADWITTSVQKKDRGEWAAVLSQYNERDWCYELYHQLRILLDPRCGAQADLGRHVRLSGESGKNATYNGVESGCRWSKNERCRIPDILLHNPLDVDNQIFAIEVKRAGLSSTSTDKVVDDLVALTEYTEGLSFTCGFFIGLGVERDLLKDAVGEFKNYMDNQRESLGFERVCHTIYACVVKDNQRPPLDGSRHSCFQPICDFLAD